MIEASRMLLGRTLLAALSLCAWAGVLGARAIVVDQNHPAASDRAPGTEQEPLKTISRAAAVAVPGDMVLIRPGTYTEGPILLTRSGSRDRPITFQAENPWTVAISGGQRLESFVDRPYPLMFGPARLNPQNQERWDGADHITVRGLIFRDARGTAIGVATGWCVEDCLIERANRDGIDARGDEIVIQRVVVQDIGGNGMAGGYGTNITVRDCIVRRCNQYPDAPGFYAGASKFLQVDGLLIENLISYDHMGSGWWLDWDNRNYIVRGCTIFGNHAGVGLENRREPQDQPWAAVGIWTEANPGPGVIENNVIYSNVAAGIGVMESGNLRIERNVIVDCGGAIEFRDLSRDGDRPDDQRIHRIADVVVTNNSFKAWRGGHAIFTTVGEFKKGRRPADYGIVIGGNTYDPLPDKSIIGWTGTSAATIEEAQSRLGMEQNGRIGRLPFAPALIATSSTGHDQLRSRDPNRFRQVRSEQAESLSIDGAVAGLRAGQDATIPVFGRTDVLQQDGVWSCEVYDLWTHRHVRLTSRDETMRSQLERKVPRHAVLVPVHLPVHLLKLEPYAIEAEPLALE